MNNSFTELSLVTQSVNTRSTLPNRYPTSRKMHVMAVPKFIVASKGSWKGKSKLNLPWLAPDKRVSESDSHLHIDCDRQNAFATITYTWSYEGKEQEGTFLICQNDTSKVVEVGWSDSWHQNTGVMHLAGPGGEADSFKTRGTYKAEGQEWGWTVAFSLTKERLTLKMENVPPNVEPQWAVEAIYEPE